MQHAHETRATAGDRRRRNFQVAMGEVAGAMADLQAAVVLAHALALNNQDPELAIARAEKRLADLRWRLNFAKALGARAAELKR